MTDYDSFAHGGVSYPLSAGTTNLLLDDADPALSTALAFFSAILDRYIGARLKAQAALHGIKIEHAVAATLALEPTPDVLAENYRFPLLAIWRVRDVDADLTFSWNTDAGEWAIAYVLPLMTPTQKVRIAPILRSVGRVLAHGVARGFDPSYRSGEPIWEESGLRGIRLREVRYGNVEAMNQEAGAYRALVGTIDVIERDMPLPDQFEPFEGANVALPEQPFGQPLIDLTEAATHRAPVLTNVVPNSGTRTGGTVTTLLGQRFHPGQPARVWFGELEARNVKVLSETAVQCETPAYAGTVPNLATVIVQNFDGQSARRPAAFTYTSP